MGTKRYEIRTEKLNLKMCDIKLIDDNLMFELKNGKRVECIPLEKFVDDINKFAKDNNQKLHIVIG